MGLLNLARVEFSRDHHQLLEAFLLLPTRITGLSEIPERFAREAVRVEGRLLVRRAPYCDSELRLGGSSAEIPPAVRLPGRAGRTSAN